MKTVLYIDYEYKKNFNTPTYIENKFSHEFIEIKTYFGLFLTAIDQFLNYLKIQHQRINLFVWNYQSVMRQL